LRSNFLSEKYQDIYFNPESPEAEKQYVFIEANRITERLTTATEFTVAELGFGFGLNYALTLHAAKKADCLHKLRYYSVDEKFPAADQIAALRQQLKICGDSWALPSAGPKNLRVHHGDVLEFLNQSAFAADAWYFDGFSPAKNPAMWSAEVFARCFALTRPGGTFSTYTSAGWVRRNIEAAGFIVNKVQGFAAKREMLVGFKPSSEKIEEHALGPAVSAVEPGVEA